MPETKMKMEVANSLEQYEALIAAYKLQNPVKYAAKLANGEFDRERVKLGWVPEKKEEPKEEVKKSSK